MSQCHANATRNPLIISECCNVALIALKIKITWELHYKKLSTTQGNQCINLFLIFVF